MRIFKNYFKIINKHKFTIGIYFLIFVVITVGISMSLKKQETKFEAYKPKIYLENNSECRKAKELEILLKDYTEQDEKLTREDAEDELFYQMISAIVVIPKDFGKKEKIEVRIAPNSTTGFLVNQIIDGYLNKVKAYEKAKIDNDKIYVFAKEDIKKETDVKYFEKDKKINYEIYSFFNMLNYTIMAQVILSVTMIMGIYNKKTISLRNESSPISKTRMTLELLLGHIILSLFVILSYIIVFAFIWPEAIKLTSVHLMIGNTLIFTIVTVSFAVMLSNVIKSEAVIQGVTNVFSLGSSFLTGAFIPQEFLSESVLNFSKIFPSYYFVTNNNIIAQDINSPEIIKNILIMLGFMLLFIIINILFKLRKKKE